MGKNKKKTSSHSGFQTVTLCISTALVLILLGLVVFFVMTAHNLSEYCKENFVVTMMLDQGVSVSETQKIRNELKQSPFTKELTYISKVEALKEAKAALGTDPSEFTEGVNPFPPSIELKVRAEYANNDSLKAISKQLKALYKPSKVTYQTDLIEDVNYNIARISIVLLFIALLLTIVSFSLINNTVRLGIYAQRFSIHTMKLVGASWSFIRWPFVRNALLVGLLAAIIALAALCGMVYVLYINEPAIVTVLDWRILAVTAGVVVFFGIAITGLCARVSVTKFLKMKAGELYNI
ncbi:MAG: permease-like cell division protein FtsX [Prevotella sp.]|nr:permease-like cell division protein FtsX [Prevotella sp.]